MKTRQTIETAREILDSMLGYLGFVVDVRDDDSTGAPALQVYSEEGELLVGRHGERLDDMQYLLNRMLQSRIPDAPRVRVDVEHYRAMREDKLIERVRGLAERVRATGSPVTLNPMNAYYRRLVHNAFKDDPHVLTWSPKDNKRIKSIVVKLRNPASGG